MPESLIDAALHYAREGWPVFPVRADKTPYTSNGVLDATTNPKKIQDWWQRWPRANVALDPGSASLMVLDLDPGHDLAQLQESVGPLPQTKLKSRTPRGGFHLFFELDKSEVCAPSTAKLAPNVDVRSFHSYVLLPPSRTADGTYEWLERGEAAFRSDAMLEKANAATRGKDKDRDTWIIEPDLEENVALAVAWLKEKAKPAIEGLNGDATAYATAAMMKSYGLSQAMGLDLMWEHWNPKCIPPWSGEDIEHFERKVENGYRYNTSPPGNMTPAYRAARERSLFTPVPAKLGEGVEVKAGRYRFVNRAGMAAIPPPEWLVKDLLTTDSYAILYGSSGAFKTFIALDIGLSIATGGGTSLWPRIETPGPVLFAAGEGRAAIEVRVEGWEKLHNGGLPAENFYLADPVPGIASNEKDAVETFIAGAKMLSPSGYRLVIIDTVSRALQGENENAQETASAFTATVEKLQRELGCSVLAVHHAGHEGTRVRGSSVFGADADTVIFAEGDKVRLKSMLTMRKQKDAEQWEKPRLVSLEKVHLDATKDTLSVTAAAEKNPGPEPESQTSSQDPITKITAEIGLKITERHALLALEDLHERARGSVASENQLADLIRCSNAYIAEGRGQSQRTLRMHLNYLRGDGASKLRHHFRYVGKKACWRWNINRPGG